MAVVSIEIERRTPYAGGRVHSARWVRMTAGRRRSPSASIRSTRPTSDIVDLDLAPRDANGRVRFTSDLCLLIPTGSGARQPRLVVELPNRGRKLIPRFVNRAAPSLPTAEIPVGDGWTFRQGLSIAWIGWQHDVYRCDAMMGLEAPEALINGKPIRGEIIVEIQPNFAGATRLLANRVHRPYRVGERRRSTARLLVRDHPEGENTEIPRSAWRFAREEDGRVVPSDEHIYLESGFEPGRIYSVIYTTEGAPVVGTGSAGLPGDRLVLTLFDRTATRWQAPSTRSMGSVSPRPAA